MFDMSKKDNIDRWDIIEKVSVCMLTTQFVDIASLVMEVTDDKSLDKAVRKKLQVEHAAANSKRAKFIKLADKRHLFVTYGKVEPVAYPSASARWWNVFFSFIVQRVNAVLRR